MKDKIMQMSRERKLFSVVLAIYWIGIFVVTHIPVPRWTRNMGMSDKTMHFVAYMLFGFLLWFAFSFEEKANWRKLKPWLILIILLLYGVADEILQRFVHRGTDVLDFAADICGAAAAMLTVTLLPGRRALIVPAVVCPALIPGLVRAGFIARGTFFEFAVYFVCFVVAGLILGLTLKNKIIGLLAAAADVAALKIYAAITDKVMGKEAMLMAFIAVVITFGVLFYVERVKRVANQDKLP
ncbi:MAG: VanZ family protein [Sedimentisphaerales bacterium]